MKKDSSAQTALLIVVVGLVGLLAMVWMVRTFFISTGNKILPPEYQQR